MKSPVVKLAREAKRFVDVAPVVMSETIEPFAIDALVEKRLVLDAMVAKKLVEVATENVADVPVSEGMTAEAE